MLREIHEMYGCGSFIRFGANDDCEADGAYHNALSWGLDSESLRPKTVHDRVLSCLVHSYKCV